MLLLFYNTQSGEIIPLSLLLQEAWFSALVGVVQSTLPEITTIYRAQSMNRANWLNLIKRNKVSPPWMVIETLEQFQEDWGRDNYMFRQPVHMYYISANNSASALVTGGGYDITRYTLNRTQLLRDSLITYNGPGFQLQADYPKIDPSERNPANLVFYTLQAQYFACQLSARLLFGETNIDGALL